MSEIFYYTGLIFWALCSVWGLIYLACTVCTSALTYLGMLGDFKAFYVTRIKAKAKEQSCN